MPMRFTDSRIQEGIKAFNIEVRQNESAREARARFAEEHGDSVEAHEVRTGKPWDEWDDLDKSMCLLNILNERSKP